MKIELPPLQDLAIDRDAGVYRFVRDGKRVAYPSVSAALQHVQGAMWATEEDLIRGRLIHRACALLIGGGDGSGLHLPSVSREILGEVTACRNFVDKTGFRAALVERPVACHEHRYCGTPDAAGEFDPKKVAGSPYAVVDWKTGSKTAADPLQLAAYRHALRESGLLWPAVRRVTVYLKEDGDFSTEEWQGSWDFRDFLTCLQFHNLTLRQKGGRP